MLTEQPYSLQYTLYSQPSLYKGATERQNDLLETDHPLYVGVEEAPACLWLGVSRHPRYICDIEMPSYVTRTTDAAPTWYTQRNDIPETFRKYHCKVCLELGN